MSKVVGQRAVYEAQNNGDDFVITVPVPGTRPRLFVVEIRRCIKGDEYGVTQVSEQMGRKAADSLAAKWAKWHRLEVHVS